MLAEQNPAGAVALLDSVNTALLDDARYADFVLLQVRAKDLADRDISGDQAIFRAKDCFLSQKDYGKAAWAYFYSGRVNRHRNESGEALQNFMEAARMAQNTNDDNLKGLIQYNTGELYLAHDNSEEARTAFRQAAKYFGKAGKTNNRIYSYNSIGNTFLLDQHIDSAFYFYDIAITLAEASPDSSIKTGVLIQNTGVALRESGDAEAAKEMYFRARQYKMTDEERVRLYHNLAQAYFDLKQSDSAVYYNCRALALAERIACNPSLEYACIALRTKLEEAAGNYRNATEYYRKQVHLLGDIFDEFESRTLIGIREKYDFDLMQNEKNRAQIAEQRTLNRLVSVAAVSMTIVAAFCIIVIRNRRRLAKAREAVQALETMVEEAKRKEAGSRKEIEEKREKIKELEREKEEIIKKADAETERERAESAKRMEEIEREKQKNTEQIINIGNTMRDMFGEVIRRKCREMKTDKIRQQALGAGTATQKSFWDEFCAAMPPGFEERVTAKYPALDKTEVRICCFEYFGCDNKVISRVLHLKPNSIHSKKSTIRSKLKLEEGGRIIDFLERDIWLN